MISDIRQTVAPLAKRLILTSGVANVLRRARPNRALAILRYHSVCDSTKHGYASPGICVTPRAFERHVEYLVRNYQVVSLPSAVEHLRRSEPLPANAVAITFDDGYADNVEAARILYRYGATATFYVAAACLVGGEPFWPAELRLLVDQMTPRTCEVEVGGEAVAVRCDTREGRGQTVSRLTKVFKSYPIPVREQLREELRSLAGRPLLPEVMLTWDQLREMKSLGMTIGAHTLTHPNLPSAGPVAAREEIFGSKERLDTELGTTTTMFSYPNGGARIYFTPEIKAMVAEAGFLAASTSAPGFAGPSSDLFALERVQASVRLEDLVFALEVERFAFKPAPRETS